MKNTARNLLLIATSFAILFIISGCAGYNTGSADARLIPPPSPEPVIAPITPTTLGSLWTERQGGLFRDLKAKDVGDIVTVSIVESDTASKSAQTSSDRSSTSSAEINALFGLESKIAKINEAINPSALLSTGYANESAGNGSTARTDTLTATLTTKVIEVLPNGNLRIDGGKTVRVNNEDQIVRLSGVIRPEDISSENIISSKYILDAKIVYTGDGSISDKMKSGWLTRIIDNVWPF